MRVVKVNAQKSRLTIPSDAKSRLVGEETSQSQRRLSRAHTTLAEQTSSVSLK
jgi:hypothetical protein